MLKTASIAAAAAFIFVSAISAQADEYLETTGNRSAAPAYSAQQNAPALDRNFRLEVRGKSAPAAQVNRTDIPGQGG
jgi:hypothetical protein